MTEQILKSALVLGLLVGVMYAILAATIGRARLLELCFGPTPVQAVDFGNLVLKETSNQHLVCPPDFCAAEVGNGDTASSNYDLLSVLLHEVGHAIGIDHPNKRCSTRDKCYEESMYSCTDAEEYMRRAINPGDEAAVQSLYGEDS